MIHKVMFMDKPPAGTPIFKNSAGKDVVLSPIAQVICNEIQKRVNALGLEVNITTLTTLMKKVSEQKYFELTPSRFIPVNVGEGAWSTNLVTWRSFLVGDSFTKGLINLGSNNGRLAVVNAAVDTVVTKVYNWATEIGWTIFELETAAKANNWDLVTNLEKSRKKAWDLGVQQVAFLGIPGFNGVASTPAQCMGLLNLQGIYTDTTTITGPLTAMVPTNFAAFCGVILQVFRNNCNASAWPNRFVVPESDYLGLATPASPQFITEGSTKKEVLERALGIMTGFDGQDGRGKFEILPCKYGDGAFASQFGGDSANEVYALYNYNEESFRMNIPVDYTSTLANSLNNIQFQNGAYGQFTGVTSLRPLEMVYFKYAASLAN